MNSILRFLGKAWLAACMALLILSGCCGALADSGDLPQFAQRRSDAVAQDFTGSWLLRWIRSEEAVDLHCYGYFDIYPNGTVCVSLGNDEKSTYYMTQVKEAGDGFLFVPDESGKGGMYLFLFDGSVLGCAETTDDPKTIYYMEFSCDIQEDQPEQERIAGVIASHIGARLYDASEQEYAGLWRAISCTNGEGELYPMYLSGGEVDIQIEAEQAVVTYRIGSEETVYQTPVAYGYDCAEIMDESGEDSQYLILCEDGRMALVEEMDFPESLIFFLPAERWEEEMANTRYNPNPKPGAQMKMASYEDIAGEWTATHINYGGLLYPAQSSGMNTRLIIEPHGDIKMGIGREYEYVEGNIEDGCLIITDAEEEKHYFLYYEGDLLIEAGDPDDLSIVIYYQQLGAAQGL